MPPQIKIRSCATCVLWPKDDERPGLRRCPKFRVLTGASHGSACTAYVLGAEVPAE
jgi:hypothetical protein